MPEQTATDTAENTTAGQAIVFDDTPAEDFDIVKRLEEAFGAYEASALTTRVEEIQGGICYDGRPFSRRILLVCRDGEPIVRLYRSGRIVPYFPT